MKVEVRVGVAVGLLKDGLDMAVDALGVWAIGVWIAERVGAVVGVDAAADAAVVVDKVLLPRGVVGGPV